MAMAVAFALGAFLCLADVFLGFYNHEVKDTTIRQIGHIFSMIFDVFAASYMAMGFCFGALIFVFKGLSPLFPGFGESLP